MNPIISHKTLIFNKSGQILTLFRTETAPFYPNTWDFPGGLVSDAEEIEASARREIKEESGLEVGKLEEIDKIEIKNHKGKDWITFIFKAKSDSDKVTLSYEHNNFRWVQPEEFLNLEAPDRLKEVTRKIIKQSNKQ